ncbi:unnamed protein product [Peniophora sp. CBMAI 1063]|nr:unnamed protein product [Peniophora sp. CBMAI 1063]
MVRELGSTVSSEQPVPRPSPSSHAHRTPPVPPALSTADTPPQPVPTSPRPISTPTGQTRSRPSLNPGELFGDLFPAEEELIPDPAPAVDTTVEEDQEMRDATEGDELPGSNTSNSSQPADGDPATSNRTPESAAPAQETRLPRTGTQDFVTREEFQAFQARVDPDRRAGEEALRKATLKAQRIALPKSRRKPRGSAANQLRAVLRAVVATLLERTDKQAPFPAHKVPTPGQISAYAKHGIGGPTMDNWRVDPTTPFSSKWNQEAGLVLMKLLLENGHITQQERSEAWKWFANHHDGTLREHYIAYNLGNERRLAVNRYRSAQTQRRETLGRTRITVCLAHADLAEVGAALSEAGPRSNVHSDDEEDHQSTTARYRAKDKYWRSKKARRYFRSCDLLHFKDKYDESGLHRTAPGNWFRERVPGAILDVEVDEPEPGLPANFYEPEWVAKQKPERLATLEMKADVPLDFPLDLRIQAARVLGILRVDGPVSDWRTLRISQAELDMLDVYLDTGRLPPATYGEARAR